MFVFGLFEFFWCVVMKCVRGVYFRAVGIVFKYVGVLIEYSMLVVSSWCTVVCLVVF
jgi:hypothetical protein